MIRPQHSSDVLAFTLWLTISATSLRAQPAPTPNATPKLCLSGHDPTRG